MASVPQNILVFGNGPVAHCLALGLSIANFSVRLVRKPCLKTSENKKDPRAWAMRPASLRFLESLGVEVTRQAPLKAMDVWQSDRDGTPIPGELHLTPNCDGTLGAILPNSSLREAIWKAISDSHIEVYESASDSAMEVCSTEGAAIALICDPSWSTGLNPSAKASSWAYKQIAVTAPVQLSKPHDGIAKQVFLPSGPLAVLPLPNPNEASLVWSITKERWLGLQNLPELQEKVSDFCRTDLSFNPEALRTFPLSASNASTYLGNGYALIGDAAHKVHPLAGQGLNLSLADVGAVIDSLAQARRVGADLSTEFSLHNYERKRRPQNEAMRAATDQLHNLFNATWGPIRFARSIGLNVFDSSRLKNYLIDIMSDETPLSDHLN